MRNSMELLIYGNSSNLKSPVHRSLGGWCIALRKAVYVRGSIGLERKKQKSPAVIKCAEACIYRENTIILRL